MLRLVTLPPPSLARFTAFLLLVMMAVVTNIFGISATWADSTVQNPSRMSYTLPPSHRRRPPLGQLCRLPHLHG